MAKGAMTLFVAIKAQVGDAVGGLREVGNEVNKLKGTFADLRMQASELGLSLVSIGGAIGGAIMKFGELGGQVDTVRNTFDRLSLSIKEDSNTMLSSLRSATNGMMSDFDLMKSANLLMSMGLADSTESASKLMNMATRLGGAMGGTATESIENFALMLANQSIPRLDSFGISSGKVRTLMEGMGAGAESAGGDVGALSGQLQDAQISLARAQKAAEGVDFSTFAGQGKQLAVQKAQARVDELTASLQSAGGAASGASREQAFLNAVLEEGAKSLEKLGDPVVNAQTAMANMTATWDNLVHRLAQAFAPVAQQIATAITKVLNVLDSIPQGVFELIAKIAGISAAAAALSGGIMLVIGGVGGLKAALGGAMPILDKVFKLLGMSPNLGAIGLALKSLVPAVFILVAASKILEKAWTENWGNIQGKVAALLSWLDVFKEKAHEIIAPWAERLTQLAALLQAQIWTRIQQLIEAFLGLQGAGGQAFHNLTTALNNFVAPFQDGLQIIFRTLEKLGLAFSAILRGDFSQAARYTTDILSDLGAFFVAWVQGLIKNAATWGRNLLVSFASGIVNAINAVLTPIMNKVGQYIALFWQGHSPPKQGVLKHIAEWGAGVMGTYLQSFGDADFNMLDGIMSPIQTALQDAVSLGNIDDSQVAGIFNSVKEQVSGVLAEFRQSGQVNSEALGGIAQALGDGGAEYTKLIQLSLEHEQALQDVEAAQNALNQAQDMGYVPAAVKAKLQAAQEEADAKKEQLSWQEQYLDALRQQTAAANAAAGAGAGTGAGAGDKAELPELGAADLSGIEEIAIPAMLEAVEIDEASIDLQLDKAQELIEPLQIPPMSDKFYEAKDAVQSFIDTVRGLSPSELVDRFANWAKEMTGIDVPGYIDTVRGAWQRLRDFFAPTVENLKTGLQGFIDKIREFGLSQETMDSLSRTTGKLQAAWQRFRETVIPLIIDFVKLTAGGLLALVRAGFDALAEGLPGLGQAIGGVIEFTAGLVEGFVDLVTQGEISTESLQTMWQGLKDFFGGLLDAMLSEIIAWGVSIYAAITGKELDVHAETERIMGLIRGAWETLTAPIQTVIDWLGKFISKGAEVGVPTGIPAIQTAINTLINPVDSVINAITNFVSKLGEIQVPEGLRGITEWISNIGDALNNLSIDGLTSKLGGIQIPDWLQGHSPPPLAEWIGFIGEAADDVSLSNMNAQLTDAMNLASAVEQGTAQFATLKLNIVTIWEETVTAVIGFAQMLMNSLETWVTELVASMTANFQALETAVTTAWERIGQTIENEMNAAQREVKTVLQQMARDFDTQLNGIANTVETRMRNARDALSSALEEMKSVMRSGATALSAAFNDNFTVANISESISLAFVGAQDTLREVINALGADFADALTALFQPAVDAARQTGVPLAVDLPFRWTPLATGGIISRPTFLVGEAGAEIVAPLAALNDMLRQQMESVLQAQWQLPQVRGATLPQATVHNHYHTWQNLHVYTENGDAQSIVTEMNRLAWQSAMRSAVPGMI